jgi:serine/threonine protein phosphatase PrpC
MATSWETAQAVESYRSHCEDRATVFREEGRVVIVVADGAGGIGHGEAAAESIVRLARDDFPRCRNKHAWTEALARWDYSITPGEATAVVVDIDDERICGASVGDSRAWQVADGETSDLTKHQVRKPLLGSGVARPVGFDAEPLRGLLIVATDGFFNYAKHDAAIAAIAREEFYALPRKLVELVRLPSGAFADDVAMVVCRPTPRQRTRQRYEI